MRAYQPLEHHRGPFQLQVCRPRTTVRARQHPYEFETLKATVKKADVQEECELLLSDPRDRIVAVYVYSVKRQQFVTVIKKGGE